MTVRAANNAFVDFALNPLPGDQTADEVADVFDLLPSYVVELKYERIAHPAIYA